MKFCLGIDGGGTHTRAWAVDWAGERLGSGQSGTTNPNHVDPEGLMGNLRECVEGACRAIGANIADCISVFWGLAGVTTPNGRKQMEEWLAACGLTAAKMGVDHDIRIALAGGLGGEPGIALIVGTGSSCYGRTSDGRTWQTGGWEALISDEGSGFFVGREAIAAAARMADGRAPETALRARVFEWLHINEVAELLPRIHEQGLGRAEIASFAPEVIQLAAGGDAGALEILDAGARLLAEMVEANYRMLQSSPQPRVVITGGVGTAKTLYRERITAAIQNLLPAAEIQEPLLAPVAGAVLLAMEQVGVHKTDKLINLLKAQAA